MELGIESGIELLSCSVLFVSAKTVHRHFKSRTSIIYSDGGAFMINRSDDDTVLFTRLRIISPCGKASQNKKRRSSTISKESNFAFCWNGPKGYQWQL